MVYDNRGYEDDEFVDGLNSRGNAKRIPPTLEFTTRHSNNKNVVRK